MDCRPKQKFRFSSYDIVLTNFPHIQNLVSVKPKTIKYFSPSIDPLMSTYASKQDRVFDVTFIGSYSRYHKKRIEF